METCVLIPQEFFLAIDSGEIGVWTTTNLARGTLFYPYQGTIRSDQIELFKYVDDKDIRHRFGLYDEVSYTYGKRVRFCNWVRFIRVSEAYDANVNMICTKVKGEAVYEVVKPVAAHQELSVFYLPEKPEEAFFMSVRTSLFRKTMDSILQDYPLDLSTSLLHRISLPISPIPSSEDEHKSVFSDSSSSNLSLTDNSDHLINSGTPSLIDTSTYKTNERLPRSCRSERTLLPCQICGKCFDRPSLLKRHMRTHTGEKPHVCNTCGKGFSTSSSLNTHRRIHSGEKPHECQVCGKRFTASSNLYYHRMTHIKEKPHKCNLCSKSFPTPGDLKSHMYVHSGTWPFKCHICFRGFSKQTNLKNHLFLHTGDKPHCCELCNKKFALACNLRAHMKTHEGDPQEDCVRCGKSFLKSAASLQQEICPRCSDSNEPVLGDNKTATYRSSEYESSNEAAEYSD